MNQFPCSIIVYMDGSSAVTPLTLAPPSCLLCLGTTPSWDSQHPHRKSEKGKNAKNFVLEVVFLLLSTHMWNPLKKKKSRWISKLVGAATVYLSLDSCLILPERYGGVFKLQEKPGARTKALDPPFKESTIQVLLFRAFEGDMDGS